MVNKKTPNANCIDCGAAMRVPPTSTVKRCPKCRASYKKRVRSRLVCPKCGGRKDKRARMCWGCYVKYRGA